MINKQITLTNNNLCFLENKIMKKLKMGLNVTITPSKYRYPFWVVPITNKEGVIYMYSATRHLI